MGETMYEIAVMMPSQEVVIRYGYVGTNGNISITIEYEHPTQQAKRTVKREPHKSSFSQKHFQKELDAYVTQEAMSDLMDNRHTYDWVE